MGLLDRYVNTLTDDTMGPYAMTEEDRKKLKKRGLLQFGLQLLANPTGQGGVFQAFGKAAAGAAQDVQQGGQDMLKSRYNADLMAQKKSEFEKQKLIDGLAAKHRNPDGSVNMQALTAEYQAIDPMKFINTGSNAELETFKYYSQGLDSDAQAEARKIALGLAPKKSSAAIKYMNVTNPDGSVSVRGFDANDPVVMNPTFGAQPQRSPAPPILMPQRMSDDEIIAQANKMAQMKMPEAQIEAWINAQKSMPMMVQAGLQNQAAPPPSGLLPGITPDEKVRRETQAKADVELATVGAIEGEKVSAAERARNNAAIGLDKDKKVINSSKILELLDQAEPLLSGATGSGLGSIRDSVGGFFGVSTDGAKATAALDTIAGQIVLSQPRMEGPQSDADRLLYAKMAGNLADSTVPTEQRLAALKQIRYLNKKYLALNDGSQKPAGPSIEDRAAKYRNK